MDNHHDEYASPCHARHRDVVLNSTNTAGWKIHSLICIFTEYTSTAVVYLHCIHTLMGYIYTEYACLYIQCKYTLHAGPVLLVYIYLGCIRRPNSAWGCIFSGCSGPFSSQSRLVLCATPRAIPIYATPSVSQPQILQFETHIFRNLRQIYFSL